MAAIQPPETATNNSRNVVGVMKRKERARTVPRSVMKVAAMMILPISVFVRPVSTSTA